MKIITANPVVGENIRLLRARYSLSQKALAKLTGISLPVLRMLERGEITHPISDETMQRLCTILNTSVQQLQMPQFDGYGAALPPQQVEI